MREEYRALIDNDTEALEKRRLEKMKNTQKYVNRTLRFANNSYREL